MGVPDRIAFQPRFNPGVERSQFFIPIGVCGLLAGCAGGPAATGSPGAQPKEYLDEQSGATISYVGGALVFSRDRTERAESVRDYVNLTAATVNRGGKRDCVLIA